MAQLTVRDVPDEIVSVLKKEAAERGMSLNAVIRRALEEYAAQWWRREDRQQAAAEARELRERIRARLGHAMTPESWELIREDRDSR